MLKLCKKNVGMVLWRVLSAYHLVWMDGQAESKYLGCDVTFRPTNIRPVNGKHLLSRKESFSDGEGIFMKHTTNRNHKVTSPARRIANANISDN